MDKKKRRKALPPVLLFLMAYVALLMILTVAERGQPGSKIQTFADAVWFSLVTISSVGYGDMTPVTPLGHAIGVIFLIMSMGVLVALFGYVVSAISSEGLPMFRLGLRRRQNWYYFAEFTAEADVLARDVLRDDPDGVIIFGINRDNEIEVPDYQCLFVNVSPARIVAHKKGKGQRCKLFFLDEDDIRRNLKAANVQELDADIYAHTASGPEKMGGNLNIFHSCDCCARSYWRDYPLYPSEDIVVIIGFGRYGTALLERAILMNIYDADFEVSYHVFGDSEHFQRMHVNLGAAMGINEVHPGHDSIFFHNEEWTAAHELISKADRIIICEDKEQVGWDDYWKLQRYYEHKGIVHLRSNLKAQGVSIFGTNEQIYTVNQIIRTRLNDAARLVNDMYRRSVENSLDWDELDEQLRQSKIATADHLITKIRVLLGNRAISDLDRRTFMAANESLEEAMKDPAWRDSLRRIEHARWVRFYAYCNWKYGEVKDAKKHENPMICEYEELTEEQKAYHDRAWELIGEIARQLS